jgi:hypothetical protein
LAHFLRDTSCRPCQGRKPFQLETEFAVRRLVIGLAVLLGLLPVIAAVQAAPQPAIGLGVPAVLAMLLVSLITFLIQRGKA